MKTYEVEVLAIVAVKYSINAETVADALESAESATGDDLQRLLQFMEDPGVAYSGESVGFIVTDGDGVETYFDHEGNIDHQPE